MDHAGQWRADPRRAGSGWTPASASSAALEVAFLVSLIPAAMMYGCSLVPLSCAPHAIAVCVSLTPPPAPPSDSDSSSVADPSPSAPLHLALSSLISSLTAPSTRYFPPALSLLTCVFFIRFCSVARTLVLPLSFSPPPLHRSSALLRPWSSPLLRPPHPRLPSGS